MCSGAAGSGGGTVAPPGDTSTTSPPSWRGPVYRTSYLSSGCPMSRGRAHATFSEVAAEYSSGSVALGWPTTYGAAGVSGGTSGAVKTVTASLGGPSPAALTADTRKRYGLSGVSSRATK